MTSLELEFKSVNDAISIMQNSIQSTSYQFIKDRCVRVLRHLEDRSIGLHYAVARENAAIRKAEEIRIIRQEQMYQLASDLKYDPQIRLAVEDYARGIITWGRLCEDIARQLTKIYNYEESTNLTHSRIHRENAGFYDHSQPNQ